MKTPTCKIVLILAALTSTGNALTQGDDQDVLQQHQQASGCPTCKWPKFSWDTLPVFFHSSYTGELGFPEQAMKTIAKFPIVTIEKWQGCHASGYTTEEEAMVEAAKQVKAANPNISVVVWFDSFRIYANKTLNPDAENSAGQFCINNMHSHFMESHPEYLLKNTSRLPAIESWGHLHVYDHAQSFMQQYWQDMCVNMTKSGVIDGCGCDGSQQRASTGEGAIPHINQSVADAWNTGKISMMNTTRLALGKGLLVGKEPEELGDYLTAIIHEGCSGNNHTITMLRNVSARSEATGVPLLFECHFSGSSDQKEVESQVAAFLIGAGEYHYWGSGSWVQQTPDFSSRWYAEFFEPPLGKPAGLATYDGATKTWSRSFASGTEVTFDASKNVGTIRWGKRNAVLDLD